MRKHCLLVFVLFAGCGLGFGQSGVGLRIGFADADSVTIANAPFQADVTVTSSQTLGDGNVLSRESRGKAMRDSAGRFRYQTSETMNAGKPMTGAAESATVVDPVADRTIRLSETAKTATTQFLGHGTHISLTYTNTTDGREHLSKEVADYVTTKDLGQKKISGLTCMGTLVTTVVPVGKMGNAKPITITDETWRSPNLQMVVEETLQDPLIGTRRVEFMNITRTEPEASVFQIPEGYVEKQFHMPTVPTRQPQ
jgi:hypothetical protein